MLALTGVLVVLQWRRRLPATAPERGIRARSLAWARSVVERPTWASATNFKCRVFHNLFSFKLSTREVMSPLVSLIFKLVMVVLASLMVAQIQLPKVPEQCSMLATLPLGIDMEVGKIRMIVPSCRQSLPMAPCLLERLLFQIYAARPLIWVSRARGMQKLLGGSVCLAQASFAR